MSGEGIPSLELLLNEIQENAEDIEKAVLYPSGFVLIFEGQASPPMPDFTMLLYYTNGERTLIYKNEVEPLLNDGILNRMKIKVELANKAAATP